MILLRGKTSGKSSKSPEKKSSQQQNCIVDISEVEYRIYFPEIRFFNVDELWLNFPSSQTHRIINSRYIDNKQIDLLSNVSSLRLFSSWKRK